MAPTHYPTAWDDPDTHRAWTKLIGCAVLGQILWVAAWVGLLVWYVTLSATWTLWLFFMPLLYTFYRAFLQRVYIGTALHARRILREHPWQVFEDLASDIGNLPGVRPGYVWLQLPDPQAPNEHVTMVMHSHVRSMWWGRLSKRASPHRKAQVRQIWFAGDPRVAGVIAVPGPRHFYVLTQTVKNSPNPESQPEESIEL